MSKPASTLLEAAERHLNAYKAEAEYWRTHYSTDYPEDNAGKLPADGDEIAELLIEQILAEEVLTAAIAAAKPA